MRSLSSSSCIAARNLATNSFSQMMMTLMISHKRAISNVYPNLLGHIVQ